MEVHVKAIILGAGYATRLRPLTEKLAKPLLPVGGRPMIDYIYDKIAEVEEVDAVHVVTNQKFASNFEDWAAQMNGRLPVTVHNDGTLSNEDRLGAIGDIRLTVERAGLAGDDLLIVAGDNVFDFSLVDYIAFWRGKGDGSCIALYQCPDMGLVKQYSIVELDEQDRITSFIEKPQDPTTNLVGIAIYIYHRDHVPLIQQYLEAGNSPDQPGNFIAWLHKQVPVYGYRFGGIWLDIGNHQQLLSADNLLRERNGLPQRDQYSVD
jgi:glucose-1-phosphate thymidylyltransferase